MYKSLSICRCSLVPVLLVTAMLASARLWGSQKSTSADPQGRATQLEKEIAKTKELIASATDAHRSSAVLSGLHAALKGEQDELKALQKTVQVEALKKHLNELKAEEVATQAKLKSLSGTSSGQQPAATTTSTPGSPAGNGSNANGQKPPSATRVSGLYTLGMGGIDITSTTTSGPQQQWFAGFDLTAPITIPGVKCDAGGHPLDSRCWVWFNPRIASVPTAQTTALTSLATSSTGLSAAGNLTLGDITQSLELRGGLEFPIVTPRHGIAFGNNPVASVGLSVLLGFGTVTPFNAASGAQEFDLASGNTTACSGTNLTGQTCGNVQNVWNQFKNNAALRAQYPQLYNALNNDCGGSPGSLANCPDLHVAFVLPNRSRFYRSYYGGFRLRTFFFHDSSSKSPCTLDDPGNANPCVPEDIFPGTLDLTFGQDETVTGGKLRGVVAGLAANYPFPHVPWLRIIGEAKLRMISNHNSEPILLSAAQTFVPLADPSLVIQNVQPMDQDYFRIGFGVDLGKLIDKVDNAAAKAPAAMLTPTGNIAFKSGQAQTITVTNVGSSPLTIDSVTSTGANVGDFVITQPDPCVKSSLDRAKGCTITVTFHPVDTTPGTRTAILTINDNAPDKSQQVTLTGTVQAN